MVVLVAPACQGLCQMGGCDVGKATSETPDCHAGAAHEQDDGQGSSVGTVANCGLRQLTAALPIDSRGIQRQAYAAKSEPTRSNAVLAASFPIGTPAVNSLEEIRLHSTAESKASSPTLSAVLRV